jgi:hypothetical protein
VDVKCIACNGQDENCETCDGFGVHHIGCPKDSIDPSTVRAIQFADFADKGHWPVSGGVLDQSQSFVSACNFIWKEEEHYKPK